MSVSKNAETKTFGWLGLNRTICDAVAEAGYEAPTPIQEKAIPLVLQGFDLLACAQTGTGKTAAFTLPLVHMLTEDSRDNPPMQGRRGRKPPTRALILTPTRELALQIKASLDTYQQGSKIRSVTIYGGVGMQPQVNALRRGVDVIVATPGRLIDHNERGNLDFSDLKFLILDEADRMLDMGFLPPIKKIVSWLPRDRQTLLFSATLGAEVTKLANNFTVSPKRVEVSPPRSVAATITHTMHPVEHSRKRELLINILQENKEQTLVFCRTKRGADRLAKVIRRDVVAADAIHGDKSQNQRTRALDAFKAGRTKVLIATDVAARGLDIPALPIVVNFDLPMVPADYIHRIGRTGRAGEDGRAISLISESQVDLYQGIAQLLDGNLTVETVEGFEPETPIDLTTPPPKKGRSRGRGRGGGGGGGGRGRPGGGRGGPGGGGGGRGRSGGGGGGRGRSGGGGRGRSGSGRSSAS